MNNPIGVFDSGVGGLSILKELRRLMPQENYIFLADQAHAPYGEKTKNQLEARALKIANFLTAQNTKLIVIACNTGTCYTIDFLRARFTLPIVGTVPAVKPACQISKTKMVGVLSTLATSRSAALKDLIKKYANQTRVFSVGCKYLENKVETGQIKSPATTALLLKYIKPLKERGIDVLVLGCTHYPFLIKEINKIAGPQIKLLDSGEAVARRARFVLKTRKILSPSKKYGQTKYFTTLKTSKPFSLVASQLLGHKITAKTLPI